MNDKANNEKLKKQMAEQLKLDNIMKSFFSVLSQKAWEKMGMVENPYTGEKELDLAEAKICIDTADYIYKVMNDKFTDTESGELRSNLTNLKINYVENVKKSKVKEEEKE